MAADIGDKVRVRLELGILCVHKLKHHHDNQIYHFTTYKNKGITFIFPKEEGHKRAEKTVHAPNHIVLIIYFLFLEITLTTKVIVFVIEFLSSRCYFVIRHPSFLSNTKVDTPTNLIITS